jgi:hypothetical protein
MALAKIFQTLVNFATYLLDTTQVQAQSKNSCKFAGDGNDLHEKWFQSRRSGSRARRKPMKKRSIHDSM